MMNDLFLSSMVIAPNGISNSNSGNDFTRRQVSLLLRTEKIAVFLFSLRLTIPFASSPAISRCMYKRKRYLFRIDFLSTFLRFPCLFLFSTVFFFFFFGNEPRHFEDVKFSCLPCSTLPIKCNGRTHITFSFHGSVPFHKYIWNICTHFYQGQSRSKRRKSWDCIKFKNGRPYGNDSG